jgi:hypothetical protein
MMNSFPDLRKELLSRSLPIFRASLLLLLHSQLLLDPLWALATF